MTRISCSVGRHSLWSMSLVVAMGTIGESAIAGDPGSVAVTVGPIGVNPHSRSGTLHITEVNGQSVDVEQPGTGVSVSKTESVAVTAAYALTNALWIQAVGAWPVDEDLRGTGLLSNQGVIGKGQQLSPALLLKCDFSLLGNALRPFVSAGVNYTTFRKTRIVNDTFRQQTYGPNSQVSASASSSVNPVVNVGADIAVDPHWFLNGVVVYAPIRTRITVRAEDTAFGTIKTRTDVRLKSIGYGLNLGYTF